mgnify:CR=1 FL=1
MKYTVQRTTHPGSFIIPTTMNIIASISQSEALNIVAVPEFAASKALRLAIVGVFGGKSNKESFQTVLREVVEKLHRISVPKKSGRGDQFDKDQDEPDLACPLTTPAFNYCFTLINAAISYNKDDEVILEQVLEMISEHVDTCHTKQFV